MFFLHFSQVSQHPACLDQSIQLGISLLIFYLPCLKQLIKQYESSWNKVVVWFAQMLFYSVYVPMLLRLSNAVKENPGPTINEIIDPNQTICADFSQGDERFWHNAGKQCVAMSLTSIVYNEIKMFDSHSRDLYGCLVHLEILTYVVGVENLVKDFQLNSHSQNIVLPFEVQYRRESYVIS